MQLDPAAARRMMVAEQLRARGITDPSVLAAMERVPRELFVPAEVRARAYDDAALPIGEGQTISQPYMVARICVELDVHEGDRVLDVGTGSGYQAAVLAELAADVVTIERIPELAELARRNLAAAGYERVEVHVGDGTLGVPDRARRRVSSRKKTPWTRPLTTTRALLCSELSFEPRSSRPVVADGRAGAARAS